MKHKALWIAFCLLAAFLVSCGFDIGSFGASKGVSGTYGNPFEEVDFWANANPLIFGTSTTAGTNKSNATGNIVSNSIVLGGNLGIPAGSVEIRSVDGAGKVSGSEDSGTFYFKEVDASKNFIMEADFLVKTFGSGGGTGDINDTALSTNGQEAWGILVHDFVPQYVESKTMDKLKNIPLTGRIGTPYHLNTPGGDSNMMLVGGIKHGVRAYWREGITGNGEALTNGGNPTTMTVQNVGNFRYSYYPKEMGDYTPYADKQSGETRASRPDFPPWGTTWKLRLEKTNNGFEYTITPPQSVIDRNKGLPTLPGDPPLIFTEPYKGTVPLYDITDSVNKTHYYVGLFASRDATVWVSNIKYYEADAVKCAPELPFQAAQYKAALEVVSPNIYTGNDYLYVKSNVRGSLLVTQDGKEIPASIIVNDWIVEKNNGSGKPCTLFTIPTYPHKDGDNNFSMVFYPEAALAPEIGSQYELTSAASIRKSFTVTKKVYNGGTGDIWVSSNGSLFGSGSSGSPLDIKTAIAHVQPGQTIILKNGTYIMEELISIPRYNNGRSGKPKTLKAETRDQVFLDWNKNPKLSASGQGLLVDGNYWVLDGFHVRNTPEKTKGMVVGGKNNIVKWLMIYSNGDTGLQISGSAAEPKVFWPSGNSIEYCESFNNRDEAEIDADGFAAKLTVGNDNVFRYCISHNNCDDGWDLFTKKDTGAIGIVKLYGCVSYENGTMLNGYSTKGGKNGFKMGGEGIAVAHELRESLSFWNGGNAVTSNSNPALNVYNSTALAAGANNSAITIYSGDKSAASGKEERNVKAESGLESADFESILVTRTFSGITAKKFINRKTDGTPSLNNVGKPNTTDNGAWVFYK